MSNELFIFTLFAIWLSVAVAIKFVTLLLLRWAGLGKAFAAALLMNITSSLLSPLSSAADQYHSWVVWLIAVVQVVVEFGVLWALARAKWRRAAVAAVLSNLVAWGLLIGLLSAVSGD